MVSSTRPLGEISRQNYRVVIKEEQRNRNRYVTVSSLTSRRQTPKRKQGRHLRVSVLSPLLITRIVIITLSWTTLIGLNVEAFGSQYCYNEVTLCHNCINSCHRRRRCYDPNSNGRSMIPTLPTLSSSQRHYHQQQQRRSISSSTRLSQSLPYGKGSEIWPETNTAQPIRLEDSFPGGLIPSAAQSTLLLHHKTMGQQRPSSSSSSPPSLTSNSTANNVSSSSDDDDDDDDNRIIISGRGRKRRVLRRTISRILRGAAGLERSTSTDDDYDDDIIISTRGGGSSGSSSSTTTTTAINKSPPVIATTLLLAGLVPLSDLLAVVSLSGYLIILTRWNDASSSTNGGGRPLVPTLPPQGHVPALVSNPLGYLLTNSNVYRWWLRGGAGLGLAAPMGALGWYLWRSRGWRGFGGGGGGGGEAAVAVARSLFLICVQATSEGLSRRFMAPLPIRIFIPVAYNTLRLYPLIHWATLPTPLGIAGRFLAVANMIYWSVNLFGFLIPTAVMRYMRAYFFCVEASEVIVREGGEGGVGLMSSSSSSS